MMEEKAFIPKFSRKEEDFLTWWTWFKHYAIVKQFGQAVSVTPEAELPAAHDTALNAADASEK